MRILTTPYRLRPRAAALAALLCAAGLARAQDGPLPTESWWPLPEARLEGAIGANLSYGSAYPGSDESGASLQPGVFLRYGRYTVSSGSDFATRRSDDVLRGLGIDLSTEERLRLGLSLRLDRGRNEDAAEALRGMGDIDPTLRLRASLNWQFREDWRLGVAWTVDAFDRGGGNLADIGVTHESRWSPETVANYTLKVTIGGERYMQTYYGVDAEQAARTGYAVYEPGTGLRNIELTAGVRTDITPRWAALAGVGVLYMVGPAADSPLTRRRTNAGFNAAFAWRF